MQRINNIEIKNFKSIRHQKIEGCNRINVFIGYPNVGKSNILEAIGLFSVGELSKENFSFNQICRVKHFSELYFNSDVRKDILVKINDNPTAKIQFFGGNLILVETSYSYISHNEQKIENAFSAQVSSGNYAFIQSDLKFIPAIKDLVGNVKKYEFEKNISINAQRPLSLAIPNGNNLFDVLQGDSNLRQEVVALFADYQLKLVLDMNDQAFKFQKELLDGTVVTIPYHQVADTLRRLIFYKAAIRTNKDSILLFEEPEAQMFPPYIKKLTTDILMDKGGNQFFIATHSPYVLSELIEEAEDDLAVYVVDYDKGETIIKRLTDEQVLEVAQYGIDLFFNLESYLDKNG